MCNFIPQIHCVVENENGSFRVERFNQATMQYEMISDNLTELVANRIKEELDADLQDE